MSYVPVFKKYLYVRYREILMTYINIMLKSVELCSINMNCILQV